MVGLEAEVADGMCDRHAGQEHRQEDGDARLGAGQPDDAAQGAAGLRRQRQPGLPLFFARDEALEPDTSDIVGPLLGR